jgi:hypothetical protein
MSTAIAVASPTFASSVMGVEDKFLAVISNRDLNVVTFFSVFGLVMTILFAVYLGPSDDPAALQTSNASQINVAQNSLGLAGTFAGKSDAERREVAGVTAPLQPVADPDADSVALADYQPLMATGLDLNGPPRRFSAKELMRNVETLVF